MKSIAVLITCFNRKKKTVDCLNHLFSQTGINARFCIMVYLVDDGSTDNTSEAISTLFPQVKIIKGDGTLYWNRGMHVAWREAAKENHEYFLWLNDDTSLYNNAIQELIIAANKTGNKAVICGCIESPDKAGVLTYGGGKIIGSNCRLNYPMGNTEPCDIINGNCVLVPQAVFEIVGNLDWKFRHAIGDNDYSLRAKKAGLGVFTTGSFIACCSRNETLPKWCLPEVSFKTRLQNLYSPLGNAQPTRYFVYKKRHFGLLPAIKDYFSIHVRVLIPGLWK